MKTGALQSIALKPPAIEALDKLPKKGKYFFWDGKSKLSTRTGSIRRMMDSLKRLTKINVHPHRFRDTFAVELLQHDVPIRTVQLLLGHTSVRTTEKHYAHYVKAQQKLLDDAVAKLDFGKASSA
jgi:integrase